MADVASNLRSERARARLSQKELARLAGVSQVTIHNIESGRTTPLSTTIASIARALGVPLTHLIDVSSPEPATAAA